MSYEQYSPLDTTLPFFSNQFNYRFSDIDPEHYTIPFLSEFKGISRRVRIVPTTSNQTIEVYLNGDLTNPVVVKSSTTLSRWIKSMRISEDGRNTGTAWYGTIDYDVVPVEYLPPKQRRAL